MSLLGEDWNDPKTMATFQLAAGLLGGGNFGQAASRGLSAYQGTMSAEEDRKLKKQAAALQMDNIQSEIQARKLAGIKDQRQQSLIESMFGGGGVGRPDAGQLPVNSGTPSNSGASSAGGLVEMAKRMGIPEQAIQSDMVFNGGKGIAAMLEKHGSRDMQVTNGYAYDKNNTGPGFMPSLSTSTSGQTSMTRIGPNGMPIVSAPEGALATFGAYKGMETGLGAAAKINLRKNADGTESPVSEFSENPVLQNILTGRPAASGVKPGYATEPQMKATMLGDMGANPAALAREINAVQNDLMKPLDEGSKSMLRAQLADLQRQAANPQVAKSAATLASAGYGMTNDQAAAAKAREVGLVDTAKAGVVRDTDKQKEGKLYGQLTAGLDRAIGLLGQEPTASGVGSMMDKTANFFGSSTKGADTASQLDTVSGWLTSNVPRMEGPQSDKDVQQYRIMAAEVGDRTKPVSQRLAAAKELQSLQAKYAELNGGAANTGGATGSFDSPKSAGTPLPANPNATNLTSGQVYQTPRGAAKWDGMKFTLVK